VEMTVNGGRPFYTILWEDGSFQQNRTGLSVGTYYVTVSDLMGCAVEDSIVVDGVIDLPSPVAEVDSELSCIQTLANLSASNSSGTGSLAYQWLDPAGNPLSTDENIAVNDIGTYTLVVTDQSNNCSAETTVEVAQNIIAPQPAAQVSGQLTCEQIEVNLDGSTSTGIGTISYQWLDPSNNAVGSGSNLNVADPGIYTLIVTDAANGCTAQTTISVDQNIAQPLPDAQAQGTLTCVNNSVDLDASGSSGAATLDYEWLDASNNSIGTGTSIAVATPGIYNLVVTNPANGCSASTTVEVIEEVDLPLPDAQVSGLLTCADLQATLDASNSTVTGAIAYEWLSGTTSLGNGATLNVGDPGTYTLVVTDTDNGCTASTTILVEQDDALPTPDALALGVITCSQDMVTLDGSASSGTGALEYEWLDAGNNTLGSGSTVDVGAIGTYTLVITDPVNGCTASTTVNVSDDLTPPTVNPGAGATLSCDVNSVSLTGSGNGAGTITYEWFNPG
ncbi:MAG: hypothetical protein AAGD05_18030, partial [Bacteroidota bacterium]